MKIVLLTPPAFINVDKDLGDAISTPLLSLAYLSSVLKKNKHQVKLFDCAVEKINFKKITEIIKILNPEVIGITATTTQIYEAHKTAQAIKKINKNIKIIIGGYHANALPKETLLQFSNFDFLIYGEGEITLIETLNAFQFKKSLAKVKGFVYRQNDTVKINSPRPFIKNLDSLPFPDFKIFPLVKYKAPYTFFKNILSLPLATSRGCPYKCNFCFRSMGNTMRFRSTESVLEEIQIDIKNYGAKQLLFTDETFGLHKKKTLMLCEAIIKNNLAEKIKWICESRVDVLDKELIKLMKKAGCQLVSLGVESGDDKILKKIAKNYSVKQVKETINNLNKENIKVHANFILGLPYETKKTIKNTINLSLKLPTDFANYSVLTPFPGTKVYEMAKKGEGGLKLLTTNWAKFGKQIGSALELKNIPRNELENLQTKAYFRFYLRPSKVFNVFKLVTFYSMYLYFIHRIKNLLSGKIKKS